MAKELAPALDDEAELHCDFSEPGSRYRHARDPTGERGCLTPKLTVLVQNRPDKGLWD